MQGFDVELPAAMVDVGCEEGRAEGAAEDAVFVCLSTSGVAGVEGLRDWLGVENADGCRKGTVEGALEVIGGDGRFESEAGCLAERMNSGIGAT